MKLISPRVLPRKSGHALLAIALSVSLAACKTQSTSSQSPSGIPASKPPSSSSPSTPSPSGSSGSQSPSSSPSQSSSKGAPQSSSQGGSSGEQSAEEGRAGSPGSPQPGSQNSNDGASGAEPGLEGDPGASAEVLDSPYYDQYDPGSDSNADVADEGTSPAARSEQGDVSFDESQAGGGASSGQSSAERQASLEAELEGSFGRYDGMILRERDKVLAEGASRGAEDQLEQEAPGFDGEGGSEGGGGNPYGDPKTQAGGSQQAEGDGQAPNESPEQGGSPGAPSGNSLPTVPDDIPDGSDDDIVARQIREAAMAEKDPKLREKLWEEYRKYKQR